MKTLIFILFTCLLFAACSSKTSETSATNTDNVDSINDAGVDNASSSEISSPGLSEAQTQLDDMLGNLKQYENFQGAKQFTRILLIADAEFGKDSSIYLFDQDHNLHAFYESNRNIMDSEGTTVVKLVFIEYANEKPFRYWSLAKRNGQYDEGIFGFGQQDIFYFKTINSGDKNKINSRSQANDVIFPFDVASFVLENKALFKPNKGGTYQYYEEVGESSSTYIVDSTLFVKKFLGK